MKKLLTFVLMVSLLCVPITIGIAVAIPGELPLCTTNAKTELYSTDTTKNKSVCSLAKGTELEIIGETDSRYRVVVNNHCGYISKTSVDLSDAPAIAEAPSSSQQQPAKVTKGMQNALKKADQYLSIMPFSHSGLVTQLGYDGFSDEEATYGADNCGADWNEQAVKKAAQYLSIMPFSKSGLITQLGYDGFTSSQAEYGVSQNGY